MCLVRQDLRDKFSTFLSISGETDLNYSWTPDSKLRHSIDKVLALEKYHDAIQEEVVRHFFYGLQSQNQHIAQISRWHFIAYLQETCIFVCKKLCRELNKESLLKDAFGTVNEAISNLAFFKNYDPSKAKFTTYYASAIRNKAFDFLTNSTRSNWGMFYYLSRRVLQENLVSISFLPHRDGTDYIYIHRFYKDICTPLGTNQTRIEPSNEQLQAICDLYNRTFYNKKDFVEITCRGALKMMEQCIDTIRNRETTLGNPKSLDILIKSRSDEGDGTSLIDSISDPSEANQNRPEDLEEGELSELEILQSELISIIDNGIASLDLEKQSIFTLIHGLNCKTTEIGRLCGANQGTISRRYHRGYDPIFDKCVIFCQQQVSSLDVNDVIWLKDLNKWIKNHLNSFYKSKLSHLLEALINSQFQNSQQAVHQFQDFTEYIKIEGENLISIGIDVVINYLQQEFPIIQSCEPIVPEMIEVVRSLLRDLLTN